MSFSVRDQILRTGFTKHLEAALLRAADLFHRFAVGDVDDHHGNVDQLGKRNGAMGGFTFDDNRPGCAVEMRRGLAASLEAIGEETDGIEILGVDHDQRAGLAGNRHHLEDLAIAERQILIGHEHLERGVAVLDQGRELLAENLLGRVRYDQVETDVDVAIAIGLGVIVPYRLTQAVSAFLQTERQHRGVATEGGGAGAAFEIVGHDDAGPARLGKVDVAVDAAGQDE